MTIAEFRQKYAADPVKMMSQIMHFGETLRGSRQYWYLARSELTDRINQVGPPTIFFTFSAADLHWPEFQDLFVSSGTTEEQSMANRRRNLNENPLLACWFLEERMTKYLKEVVGNLFTVTDSWYRYEWQSRGSGHVHGFLWIAEAPNIREIDRMTEEERQKVISFFDGMVSAWNVKRNETSPAVHPCQLPMTDLKDDGNDLGDCQNKLQRHTRCAPGYCVVIDKKTKQQVGILQVERTKKVLTSNDVFVKGMPFRLPEKRTRKHNLAKERSQAMGVVDETE